MSEQTMVRHTLPNGLRVLILPMPHTRAATVSVFCGAGSRYEPYDLMGLSHFMEHMLFKGTAQRPDPQEIAEAVERTGGLLNASTGREATVLWAKVASQHLAIAFDILSDIILNPALRPDDVERERGVILEELELYQEHALGLGACAHVSLAVAGPSVGRRHWRTPREHHAHYS